ncbi:FG-GAP repeat domain-containing protein [Streptosporangium sp. KLBMP 9127]|nr:VCBS repeat-containing protein [Streptosporangium sp. KLBMP 9127]
MTGTRFGRLALIAGVGVAMAASTVILPATANATAANGTKGAAIPDFNGDGVGDIFSTKTGALTIWYGKGNNKFSGRKTIGGGWAAYGRPISGDYASRDGIADLMAVKKSDGLLYGWKSKGGNAFGSPGKVKLGYDGRPYAETLAALPDVNKDGLADIAASRDGVIYVVSSKDGKANKVPGTWTAFTTPIAGDFNGDGIGDLMAVKKDTGALHIANGKGANDFTMPIQVGPGWGQYAPTLMSLGDVNKDGRTDIAATASGTLYLWNGKGKNTFGSRQTIGTGWTSYF